MSVDTHHLVLTVSRITLISHYQNVIETWILLQRMAMEVLGAVSQSHVPFVHIVHVLLMLYIVFTIS